MEKYENLVRNLFLPLVMHPDDLVVKTLSEENDLTTLQVLVNSDDLGRVIGKNGRVANAVRTIAYAGAAKRGKRVRIDIDSF
ncbi:KH domain-containing protein [Mycoplasmatota bacterium]|nr:KH domain-containing protein [Mycoplasmatota bacterium]